MIDLVYKETKQNKYHRRNKEKSSWQVSLQTVNSDGFAIDSH